MITLIAKLDQQLKNFKSTHQREQTAEQTVEDKRFLRGRPASCFHYINKKKVCCQEWDSNPRLQE